MSYTQLPYLVEGEIIRVADQKKPTDPIRYICKVTMENGSEIILTNVQSSTMFGGIADYMQIRHRTAFDGQKEFQKEAIDEKLRASVGDRVYITFINGSFMKPIIIGYAQHPNQTSEYPDNYDTDEPSAILQYLGIRIEINKDGEMRFIHKGAPDVKFSPKSSGVLGSAASALSGALSTLPVGLEDNNQAVTNQDQEEITLFELLKGGVFRIRDSDGQIIEIDRTKKRIYLNNNDLKSTEKTASLSLAVSAPDAEYVLLDKDAESATLRGRKLAKIHSSDKREDLTEGNFDSKILGNNTVTIKGDETTTISGSISEKIAGKHEEKVAKDWTVQSLGDVTIEGSTAKLKLSKGKVGLGGPTAELLDLFDQQLAAHLNNASSLVLTSVGPGVLNPALVTTLTQIKTFLGTIKGGI